MEIWIIFLALVVILAVVVAVMRRPHKSTPDEPLRNDPDGREGSDVNPPYPGLDRPGGPGLESMTAPEPGDPAPDADPRDSGDERTRPGADRAGTTPADEEQPPPGGGSRDPG